MAMFGLGPTEIILIVLALVVLFGAKKLPELARGLGRSSVEFRKGLKDGGGEDEKDEKKEEKSGDEKNAKE